MTAIAFLGLGNMGAGMAANLVRAGFAVRGFDPVAAARANAEALGVEVVPDAASAIESAGIVLTMLPSVAPLRDVYESAIFGKARGALLVDCSTIGVTAARTLAAAAQSHGLTMIDAPVSGGVTGARQGSLTFMVGGEAAAVERARPVLEKMGKAVIHAGASGAGQAAKLCNNLMLAIDMVGVSEAFILAQRLGLDPQVFFDIAAQSSGQSWALTSYCPVPGPVPAAPSNRDFSGGFSTDLMLKDVRLALDEAERAGAAAPLSTAAAALYEALAARGDGGKDFSAIIEFLGRQA
jgi:3-hydroxyisobutyrate dehydrogenase